MLVLLPSHGEAIAFNFAFAFFRLLPLVLCQNLGRLILGELLLNFFEQRVVLSEPLLQHLGIAEALVGLRVLVYYLVLDSLVVVRNYQGSCDVDLVLVLMVDLTTVQKTLQVVTRLGAIQQGLLVAFQIMDTLPFTKKQRRCSSKSRPDFHFQFASYFYQSANSRPRLSTSKRVCNH